MLSGYGSWLALATPAIEPWARAWAGITGINHFLGTNKLTGLHIHRKAMPEGGIGPLIELQNMVRGPGQIGKGSPEQKAIGTQLKDGSHRQVLNEDPVLANLGLSSQRLTHHKRAVAACRAGYGLSAAVNRRRWSFAHAEAGTRVLPRTR
jgi:hypothetical protein